MDVQLLIIVAIIIGSALLLLSIIGLFLLIRKCLKLRRKRSGSDVERGKSKNEMNEKLMNIRTDTYSSKNNINSNTNEEASVVVQNLLKPKQPEIDSKSVQSNQSVAGKFSYNEYPAIKPTNPIYNSTAGIKPAKKLKMISKPPKYNPLAPKPITDWRWFGIVSVLFFFPTGLVALGLSMKAQRKFRDGFLDDSKKLNKRAVLFAIISVILGLGWILGLFFGTDKWPRTNG